MSYTIIRISALWSTDTLIRKVENLLHEKTKEGFEVVTVSFGLNMMLMPAAFITLRRA